MLVFMGEEDGDLPPVADDLNEHETLGGFDDALDASDVAADALGE